VIHRISAAVVAALVALSASPIVVAQTEATYTFDIPAQDLGSALRAFGRASKQQIVFDERAVREKLSPALAGALSTDAALEQLLAGTGLRARRSSTGVIVIERETSGAEVPDAEPRPTRTRVELEEIVVAGSRLGATATQSAQPTRLLSSEYIQRSGAATVAQVLNTLTEVSVNASGSNVANTYGASTVQLRGLPIGTTLVLINGRRIESTGVQATSGYFDLNTIPLAAVERVEVLPSGSSAVYGGDALAGVVNIVLKKELQGFHAELQRGRADGYDDLHSSVGFGRTWSRGSLSVIGSFSQNSELTGAERSITATQDFTGFGGTDQRSTTGNPGTVYSRTTQNLPGLDARFAAVPTGSSGTGLTPADFAATAGLVTRTSTFAKRSFFAPQDRLGVLAYGTFSPVDEVELFTELLYSENETRSYNIPPLMTGGASGSWVVSAANPYNPFGVDVGVDYLFDDAYRQCSCIEQDYRRGLVGARGSLASWNWEVATWLSRDAQDERRTNALNAAAVRAALASSDPATALNVFQEGRGGSPALIESLLVDARSEYSGELRAMNAFLRGPLFTSENIAAEALIGAEYSEHELAYAPGDSFGVKGDRDERAIFSELRVRLPQAITLNGAVRYDHYSDFGGRVSAGAGVEFRPAESVLLRAAYSTAFKPPSLYQLFRPRTLGTGVRIVDPRRGGEAYVIDFINGGNPDLDPQTGRSVTWGVVYAPPSAHDLRVSFTHWDLHLENGFVSPTSQSIVDNPEIYPGRITRDSSGRVTLVDQSFLNFGYIDEAGIDMSAEGRVATFLGNFRSAVSISNVYRYERQAVVGAVPTSNVSQANSSGFAPRWKGTVQLGWDYRDFQMTTIGRYVGKYRDYAPLSGGVVQMLGNNWFADLNVRYEIGGWLQHGVSQISSAYVSLSAVNLFDRRPEYSNFATGFDFSQEDLRGRYAFVKVGLSF